MKAYNLTMKGRVIFALAGVFVMLALLCFPVKTFISNCLYVAPGRKILNPISTDTMKDYLIAADSIEKIGRRTSSSFYHKTAGNAYFRLGKWMEIMAGLGLPRPEGKEGITIPPSPGEPVRSMGRGEGRGEGAISGDDAYLKAEEDFKEAIRREPLNPDYHFALGKLYDTMKKFPFSKVEFERTLKAYPMNAPLRHAVAMQYLLTGRRGDAIAEARALADIDRSYMMPAYLIGAMDQDEWRLQNASKIYRSYLFAAFEIAWRASKDKEVVRGIAPGNPEAKEVMEMFFEWRGIDAG